MTVKIVLRSVNGGGWLSLDDPERIVVAWRVDEVAGALAEVESAVERKGLTAVGYLAYEAAPAFDPALTTHPPSDGLPLLWFGLSTRWRRTAELPLAEPGTYSTGKWHPTQSAAEHRESVRRIRSLIARGDTYQVNHTLRLRASFDGDPAGLFCDLVRSQPRAFAGYLDLGEIAVCSASPELFFRLDGDRLISKPMKGTVARGWSLESDQRRSEWLASSKKDRAENAMIVDMVRNDLGRIAHNGSVEVTRRFEIERHPTVFQMTSTVEARTGASIVDILAAVFPFASVTGAPKIRTMQLIAELEGEPRGVYTGAIGILEPGRRAAFSVGIRTAVVDRKQGALEYGVGSGIVWDSRPANEYEECIAKARVLTRRTPEFDLLETMIWSPDGGFELLERHLDRLAGAAGYFDRPLDPACVRADLDRRVAELDPVSHRVRLLIAPDGTLRMEFARLDPTPSPGTVRLGLARDPVDRRDPFLHFKTTHREVYQRALESRPGCDDVLLWNERGEITESTIANVVVRDGRNLVTPPVECGLLPGTMRAEMIDRDELHEQIITVDDIEASEEIYLINSVQGKRLAEWVPATEIQTAFTRS
jgi:para-aminobenzoate synthetase/4-amino-4-deoxychorismate lyase